jgi:DNA-directed RNA polymerase subunit RPC12/RpoP
MTSAMMNYIPLNSAYLCQDCDAVGNSAMRCPACGSQVLMGLARVFDRKAQIAEPRPFLVPTLAAYPKPIFATEA